MTVALATLTDRLTLPAEAGVSPRAVRCVFRMMAKIANDAGEFKYGLRGSKLATLTDYSLSVVRRAQRLLVDHGYVERLQVGGGRASTKWRICVDKLAGQFGLGHTSGADSTRQPAGSDTAQDPVPSSFPPDVPVGAPPRKTLRESLAALIDPPLCVHGFTAGLLPGGRYRCPLCRRHHATRVART